MANWIILTAIFAVTILIIRKLQILQPKTKSAYQILEEIFFPQGNAQKNKVINAFKKITNQNFSDDEIIDFFLKEKGLQMLAVSDEMKPSVIKYIRTDTLINLNYFERVKFQEVFINYPQNFEIRTIESAETVFETYPAGSGIALIA
jgi:hypothetical protein